MLRTLIIGYGNPLRSDDGFGWQVANHLSETVDAEDIEIIACHQLTPELAEPLSRAETVVFIDASAEAAPGRVDSRQIEVDASTKTTSFSHGFDAQDLLFSAATLYGSAPNAHIISVGGESFEMGEKLSATMLGTLPQVIVMIQQIVAGNAARTKGE